ncbi:MAG: DUF2156 domain-containing protein [Armatimonadetes bacterium]|jgi:hypothetical protein|nr:DUF2156 domain-containing protein [Armatimonadota bacterium]
MNMIPEYPQSRQITLRDKPFFDAVFAQRPTEISAYSFTNIFAWRESQQTELSRIYDHILLINNQNEHISSLEPLGVGSIKPVVEEMIRRSDRPVIFERISGEAGGEMKDIGLIVEYDPDNSDYVYAAQDLIELAGRRFDGKRNFIARARSQIEYEYVKMDESVAVECEAFADLWCEHKMCETIEGLRKERCAVNQMLTNFDSLGIVGGAIRAGGAIVAFSLGEKLNDDTLVIHAEKAHTQIDGLYQLINNEFCKAEAQSYKYVNREQDLGIPGLRKAKQSYHPVRLIETFTAKSP